MAGVPNWPLPDSITKFAEQYGHPPPWQSQNPTFNHDILNSTLPLKSGVTPLDKTQFVTASEQIQYDALSAYQRRRFSGFTAAELEMLEAFALTSNLEPSVALSDVPLHPLLVKERWEKEIPKHWALFPMRNGSGYWEASNPVVWQTILPSLHLATLFLSSPQTLSWWNALILSPRVEFAPGIIDYLNSKDSEEPSTQFRYLDPQLPSLPKMQEKIQSVHSALGQRLEFHICSGLIDPDSGTMEGEACAITGQYHKEEPITVSIAFEMMEALLIPDITPAQIMVARFRLSITILHELAHAIGFITRAEHNVPELSEREPYFEDEVIAELGFSMENAVFGGLESPLTTTYTTPAKGPPSGAIFSKNWNCVAMTGMGMQALIKEKPNDWETRSIYPIPVEYSFKLHKSDFWEYYVRRYGPTSVHLGPKTIGNIHYSPNSFIKQDLDLGKVIIIDASKMSKGDIIAAQFEVARRDQASRILESMKLEAIPITRERSNSSTSSISLSNIGTGTSMGSTSFRSGSSSSSRGAEPTCLRFDEIRTYLFSKRKELALDTLSFKMPEHVLFAHILREGGLVVSHVEWRQFLLRCDFQRQLFRYEFIGAPPTTTEGLVTRTPEGWPDIILPTTNLPSPTILRMDMFFAGLKEAAKMRGIWELPDHFDIDKELLRRLINYKVSEMEWVVNGKTWTNLGFNATTFDMCIAEYEKLGLLCFGPKGIVRRLADMKTIYLASASNSEASQSGDSSSKSGSNSGSSLGGPNDDASNDGSSKSGSNSGSNHEGSDNGESSDSSSRDGSNNGSNFGGFDDGQSSHSSSIGI